jgi:glycosyltransferase involved in cell wall biosynthesis/peptidoglycan/xylan/chitin deacetylase (PgdA/CDA1 family)
VEHSFNKEKNMVELSVIIPTYNRVDRLQACLEAISRQTQPSSDFEVIVVVDGSTDNTASMLSHISTPYTLKVLFQKNMGQHIARNIGIANAVGSYCLFLDDDIIPEPELISEHFLIHQINKKVIGIGQIILDLPEHVDWFTKRFGEGWSEHYKQLNQGLRLPSWTDCYGGNFSVSRKHLHKVGGFARDIRRSHDIELAYRLQQHGLKFVYLPQAIGRQIERKKLRELLEDAAKSGSAWVALCRRHPAMLPDLLGPLGNTSRREALLRMFFWRCKLSPWILAGLGSFLAMTRRGNKWYRFLFLLGYWWGVRQTITDKATWQQMIVGVPILMYHAFGESGEPASQFVLPKNQFSRQMAWLKRLNYHVLSLEEYLNYRQQHKLPPPRSIIITIDDGYVETVTLALPILHHHDYPATVFLVTGKVGSTNCWADDLALKGRQLMSWQEIKEMANKSTQFGAHTQNHPNLTSISVEQAWDEITGSKTDLERELQTPVIAFAYPFGEFNESVQALVEQAGFLGSCTVEGGSNSWSISLSKLRRIEVVGTWSLLRFLINLILASI